MHLEQSPCQQNKKGINVWPGIASNIAYLPLPVCPGNPFQVFVPMLRTSQAGNPVLSIYLLFIFET
jgi:hypothetical protein